MIKRDSLGRLPQDVFQPLWQTILALAPGLHPDEIGQEDSGWESNPLIRSIGREALNRYQTGELSDKEFYDYEAQRSGMANRDTYPNYRIDLSYVSNLNESVLQRIYKLLIALPLNLEEEIDLKGSWGDHPVIKLYGKEILQRFPETNEN